MSSTAIAFPSRGLSGSFGELAHYLGNSTYPLPQLITQEPGPAAQFAMAGVYLRLAFLLIWQGLAMLPGHVHAAAHRRLARIPRATLLAVSTSGLVAWAWAFAVTVLFIWR
jgi:hypothetical protein